MMKHTLQTTILLLIALIAPLYATAADIVFSANAESTAIVGEPFRLQFQVNESGKDLRLPAFDGFEIISGRKPLQVAARK